MEGRIERLADLVERFVEIVSNLDTSIHEERKWQRRFAYSILIVAITVAATGAFMAFIIRKVDSTTRSTNNYAAEAVRQNGRIQDLSDRIADCTDPQGKCFKDTVAQAQEAARQQAEAGNKIAQDAAAQIVAQVNAATAAKVAELQRQIAAIQGQAGATTSTTRPTVRPTATTTTTRPAATTTTTVAPQLLCALLRLGC